MSIYSRAIGRLRSELLTFHYLRFLVAGGSSVVINVALRILLSRFMAYMPAIALAYVASTLLAFVLNKVFVFAAPGRSGRVQLAYFVTVNIVGLVQTLILSRAFTAALDALVPGALQLSETLAHIAALSTLAITSFLLHKNLTFAPTDAAIKKQDMDKPKNRTISADLIAVTALIAVWAALAVAVQPLGDFALHDDWSYGRSVKMLIEQHRIYMDGWTTATFYFQAVVGALFCLPLGFSFSALRVSTIVMGGLGVVALYCLLRLATTRKSWAALGALSLMLSPLYYENSFNFMTDVPYTVLATIACLFLLKGLRDSSARDKAAGFAFLCCAVLIRQIVMPLALAYGLLSLYKTKVSWRNLARAFWPAVGVELVLATYNISVAKLGIALPLADAKERQIGHFLVKYGYAQYTQNVLLSIYTMLAYLCVLLFPLTVVLVAAVGRRWFRHAGDASMERVFMPAFVFLIVYLVVFDLNAASLRLLGENLYQTLTLGPCDMIARCGLMQLSIPPSQFPSAFIANSIVSLIITTTFCFLMIAMIAVLKRREARTSHYAGLAAFSLLALLGTMIPFAMFLVFDRYVIPLMPFFALLLVAAAGLLLSGDSTRNAKTSVPLAAVLSASVLLVYAVISVAGTHDYLAWNRARWLAVSDLIHKKGIQPANIDGGFAVTGWNLYASDKEITDRFNQQFFGLGRFAVPSAGYVIAFDLESNRSPACGPGSDQSKVASYPISSWLLRSDLEIGVFQSCAGAHG